MNTPIHRTAEGVISDEIGDIDVRAFNGKLDLSDLPSAYNSAAKVCEQIDQFGLANVIDATLGQHHGRRAVPTLEREEAWPKTGPASTY